MKSICALVLLALVSAALGQAATFGYVDSSTSLPGPSSWGTLPGSAVCSTGRFQSPINVVSSFAAYHSSYGNLAFSYSPDTTIQITETGSGVSLTSTGFANNILSVSNVLNGTYVLNNVDFHWAQVNTQGSEHQIDFEPASGEIQFVHYNTQYSSLQAAIASNQPQAVAIVSVLLVVQNRSPKNLTALINAMNTTAGPLNSVFPGSIDFTTLFPTNRKYYTYSGSLTTPSCNEVVQWFLLSHYTRITPSDIVRLRNVPLQLGATTYGVGANYRPVQTQGQRKVTANFIPNNGDESSASSMTMSMMVVCVATIIGAMMTMF